MSHHERWDGEGYPGRMAGEVIPLVGRIVALADVFDALTHSRPYKAAQPVQLAAAEIRALSGSHFDPRIVDAFEALDPDELLAPLGGGDRPTANTGSDGPPAVPHNSMHPGSSGRVAGCSN
jgi:hypothetical protein